MKNIRRQGRQGCKTERNSYDRKRQEEKNRRQEEIKMTRRNRGDRNARQKRCVSMTGDKRTRMKDRKR